VRVLFLTHSYPRTPGDAAGSFLWHLAIALRQEGVDVQVVAPSSDALPAVDEFDGIRVERFRYAPRRYENLAYTGNMAAEVQRSWSAKLALAGFLSAEFAAATRARRAFAPDVIHAHWWFPGGLVGTWAAALGDVPLVTTMHGSDVRLARTRPFAKPLLRHVLRHSKAVTTVSRWLASEVRAMVPAADPLVAPMPVATTMFSPGGVRSEDHVLFVGRLNAQKGASHLLEALAAVRHPAVLDLVGDGPDREALRAQAQTLGLGDRVRWHGALPQPALRDLYRTASLVAMPSVGEGLGLVAAEAMLCEAPVVAFASGGITDVVQHDETGLLVSPGDAQALAMAIDDLLGDAARRERLGRAGRLHALALFAPESAARRYAQLYHTVSRT
jgi:glycosyltransferase involved in cell wall biosynthesis